MSFKITKEWLNENKTKNGGYCRTQVEALFLDWPLKKGWKKKVLGMEIDSAQKRTFEKHGHTNGYSLLQRVIAMCRKLSRDDQKVVYEVLRKSLTK